MVLAVLLAAVTLATAATQQQGYWKCPKDRCRFIGEFGNEPWHAVQLASRLLAAGPYKHVEAAWYRHTVSALPGKNSTAHTTRDFRSCWNTAHLDTAALDHTPGWRQPAARGPTNTTTTVYYVVRPALPHWLI